MLNCDAVGLSARFCSLNKYLIAHPMLWRFWPTKVKKHGADQVQVWRRSFDIPPPPLEKDNKYHPCHEAKYAGMDPKAPGHSLGIVDLRTCPTPSV